MGRKERGTRRKGGQKEETPWPESANELYQPSDRRLSGKLVQTFPDEADPYDRNL
jgi:hypothetical protein